MPVPVLALQWGLKMDRLIDIKEVTSVVGFGKNKIYQGLAQGWFPPGVLVGRRNRKWRASEIQNWIAALPAARGVDHE